MRERRACRGPEPERAVDVHPGVRSVDCVRDRLEVVERARVDVARLRADDRRDAPVDRGGKTLGLHPPLAVRAQHDLLLGADPEQAERAHDRHVACAAHDDAQRRRARESLSRKIPAGAAVDGVPRGRETRDVGHLTPGDERKRGMGGKPEQLEQPPAGDDLERRRRRRRLGETGVLVPRGDEPVARERRRQGTTCDEAEPSARADRHDARLRDRRELLDDHRGVRRMLGERAVEQREHLAVATLRPHGSRVERLEVVGRDRRRPRQQLPLRHAAESTRRDSPRRVSAVSAASTRITSQIQEREGRIADGTCQSSVPRFTSCSFQAS